MDKTNAQTHEERIAELERQIRVVRAEKAEAEKARKTAIKPKLGYTMLPCDNRYEKIMDDSVVQYRLTGTVENKDELLAAGYSERELEGGGMTYLFNKLSGKLIMANGGGRVYLSYGWAPQRVDKEEYNAAVTAAFNEINFFLRLWPNGGDITTIMDKYNERIEAAKS